MKAVIATVSISLLFFLGGSCTREEQAEVQKPVAVRSKIPGQQKSLARGKPGGEPVKEAPGVTEAVTPEKRPLVLPPAEQTQEQPAVSEPVQKMSGVIRPAAPEEKPPGSMPAGQPEKQLAVKEKGAYYKVRKGDSLSSIAGRKGVYGDPIKWPSLFRLNMDSLGGMKVVEDFRRQELPEGLDLRFVTPAEAAENLTELGHKVWVVNVLSSRTSKKIVPAAITLMKKGFRVYITKAIVKEIEWIRLRVGFFKDRPDAVATGKEITSVLDAADVWIVEIGEMERAKFGGY